jgi:hypothetical protein
MVCVTMHSLMCLIFRYLFAYHAFYAGRSGTRSSTDRRLHHCGDPSAWGRGKTESQAQAHDPIYESVQLALMVLRELKGHGPFSTN